MASHSAQATGRAVNLLGAAAVGIVDAMSDGFREVAGLDLTDATALVALLDFAPSQPIRFLSQVLGLTHSGAVRLVDRLSAAGFMVRETSANDERAVALRLTQAGRHVALRLRRRRAAVLRDLLHEVPSAHAAPVIDSLETLVGAMTRRRLAARRVGMPPSRGALCRLCDFGACQRRQGRCPANAAVVGAAR